MLVKSTMHAKQTDQNLLQHRVLIGDSIERFSLDYFCDLLQGELSIVDMNHPYSPPPFKNLRDEFHEKEEIMRTWTAE